MNCSKKNVWVIVLLLAFFSFPHVVFANKASVTIEAPESAVKESEITIKITVTHSANAMFHHVKWVYVMMNGKEIARWDYSMFNLPKPDGKLSDMPLVFTKEIKYTVHGRSEITAEASCNIHGSMGPAKAQVSVSE